MRNAGVILLLITIFAAGFGFGYSRADSSWQIKTSEAELGRVNIGLDQMEKIRALEQKLEKRQTDIDAAYQEGLEDGKANVEKIVADISSGNRRVREHFRCPNPVVPATPAAASKRDEAGEGGLRAEDGAFLVRIAGECDAIARQLSACQQLVNSYHEQINDGTKSVAQAAR